MRVRTNKDQIDDYREKIKSLLEEGFNCTEIACKLERERTTISYHKKRLGVKSQDSTSNSYEEAQEKYRKQFTQDFKEKSIKAMDERLKSEKVNKGKTYEEYLKKEEDKRFRELLNNEM